MVIKKKTPLMVATAGKSPLAWLGGKSRLAETIVERIPAHTCYCEVFAGAAWVFFKKPPSKVEIINDINRELTTLYRCVRHHLPELVAQFRWMLVARDEFDNFMATPADALTDIQRSARFFYLAKTAFGAKIKGQNFGISATGAPRLNLPRIEEDLSEAHIRLSRAFIENKSCAEVIKRFDKPGTFFYIDPPYWDCEDDYGKGLFSKLDFELLAGLLRACKGKFLVSLNDTPEVRQIFAGFQIEAVKTRYSVCGGQQKLVGEVLISNYKQI